MSDRFRGQAIAQSMLPIIDEGVRSGRLSDTQYLIKNKLDDFIVSLLGGFSNFPDNRNKIEAWSKYHPRVAVYPAKEGWDEKDPAF